MERMHRCRIALPACLVAATAGPSGAAEVDGTLRFAHPKLEVRLAPRTPQQIAAFYIGRGFPQDMVDLVRQRCFITVIIRNKSQEVIWLELDNWRFYSDEGEVKRLDRRHWNDRWQQMDAPMSARSTFRWTLLPEVLDFRPAEAEGGNIILPRTSREITLEAQFDVGANREGEAIRMRIDNLRCARDPAP